LTKGLASRPTRSLTGQGVVDLTYIKLWRLDVGCKPLECVQNGGEAAALVIVSFRDGLAEAVVGSRRSNSVAERRSCHGGRGGCLEDKKFATQQNSLHGRARWLRRHFRIGDNMARPAGVACKATLIRSTVGDGSGGITSSRLTKLASPRSTSHSSEFLTRSRQQAFSNAVALKYWSDQSGRMLFGTVRDRLASCLKSAGCV
jgi:hypothetical protein